MNDLNIFLENRKKNMEKMSNDSSLIEIKDKFMEYSGRYLYSYNFDWLGVPIIQLPQDIIGIQEVIWKTKPDIIIETGVARGGSLILSASILHLLNSNGLVIGIDIDIREHNRKVIEEHSLSFRIKLIQGSSSELNVIEQIKQIIKPKQKVMVILDSNHTHEHVLKELELYSSFVTKGCYLVVMDTVIDDMPADYYPDRPWGRDDNPKTAIRDFLKLSSRFEIDKTVHNKLLISMAPDGFLRCTQ